MDWINLEKLHAKYTEKQHLLENESKPMDAIFGVLLSPTGGIYSKLSKL